MPVGSYCNFLRQAGADGGTVGERAIIANANDRQTPQTAPFINGYTDSALGRGSGLPSTTERNDGGSHPETDETGRIILLLMAYISRMSVADAREATAARRNGDKSSPPAQ